MKETIKGQFGYQLLLPIARQPLAIVEDFTNKLPITVVVEAVDDGGDKYYRVVVTGVELIFDVLR